MLSDFWAAVAKHAEMYRDWLMREALPLWHAHGLDAHGGFHELLGPDGVAVPAPRRARVQGRQSFVFATAAKMGWGGDWQGAADHGLAYLDRCYRRADGLYSTLVAPDGALMNETAMTYDQAFAMLAAAAIHRNAPSRQDARAFAEAHLARVTGLRGHDAGGFREEGPRPFASNPHMHLLEAALAWMEAGGGPAWHALAQQIVMLALEHFLDRQHGVLREFFAANWQPLAGDAGQIVEPGHQFEWAWLLERWARLRGDVRAHEAALNLFAAGKRGVDARRNVVMDETDMALRPRRATARLWPQTERLKAAALLGDVAETNAAAASLWAYLDTPVRGLWYDRMLEDGTLVVEPAPASTFYHLICAVDVLQTA